MVNQNKCRTLKDQFVSTTPPRHGEEETVEVGTREEVRGKTYGVRGHKVHVLSQGTRQSVVDDSTRVLRVRRVGHPVVG